jgi:hypothetical protein
VVALRSRRLEALFGAVLEAVTVDNVRGLITAGAQEAFDLDFKLTWYAGAIRTAVHLPET